LIPKWKVALALVLECYVTLGLVRNNLVCNELEIHFVPKKTKFRWQGTWRGFPWKNCEEIWSLFVSCTYGIHFWECLYRWRTCLRIYVHSTNISDLSSESVAAFVEGVATMREQFASIVFPSRPPSRLSMHYTHSSILEWFSLLWCSFLEILGGSLFRSGSPAQSSPKNFKHP
jgi:hypothetical protein